jgi:AcrR family transcriptional regulator
MGARAEMTRLRLFEATLDLVGSRGVDDTTVDQIAQRARVAKATIYYHFEGKADLIEAAIEQRGGVLVDRFARIAERTELAPLERIAGLVRAQLEFLTGEHAFTKLITCEMWRTDRPWHPTLTRIRHDLTETICGVVSDGIADGSFRPGIDPDFAGYLLFGMTTFSAIDRFVHEPERPYDDLLEQITGAVAAAVRP